jgi:transcriptional regulator with XRE-family HTH domain
MTQVELGARIDKPQSVIARWERGDVVPSLETLRQVVLGCELELHFHLSRTDDSNASLIDAHLKMSTSQRFADLTARVDFHDQRSAEDRTQMPDPVTYHPDRILRVLEQFRVDYVLIGGLSAALRGSPYATRNVDITPSRESASIERLAWALQDLGAEVRFPSVEYPAAFHFDQHTFDSSRKWTFVTADGFLNIATVPDGTYGYDDLRRGATRERLAQNLTVNVAALADVIRSKEAAGRESDRAVLPVLRQVLERSRWIERD